MDKRMYQGNIVIAEKEDLFFKEVVFDFSEAEGYIPIGYEIGKIFMVESINEKLNVKAYPTADRAVMFNAWITKNIMYKTVRTEYNEMGNYGAGFVDKYGNPTVSGPMYQMTKVINFGGNIILDLPKGERLRKDDVIEVVSAEIVGTHDELLNKEPIYKTPDYQGGETQINILDENLNLYGKLIEKMCIKIKVRVIRKSLVDFDLDKDEFC